MELTAEVVIIKFWMKTQGPNCKQPALYQYVITELVHRGGDDYDEANIYMDICEKLGELHVHYGV